MGFVRYLTGGCWSRGVQVAPQQTSPARTVHAQVAQHASPVPTAADLARGHLHPLVSRPLIEPHPETVIKVRKSPSVALFNEGCTKRSDLAIRINAYPQDDPRFSVEGYVHAYGVASVRSDCMCALAKATRDDLDVVSVPPELKGIGLVVQTIDEHLHEARNLKPRLTRTLIETQKTHSLMILGGWKKHGVVFILRDNNLYICNRGDFARKLGDDFSGKPCLVQSTVVYHVPDTQLPKVFSLIKKASSSSCIKGSELIYKKIAALPEVLYQPTLGLTATYQSGPNCAYISVREGAKAVLVAEALAKAKSDTPHHVTLSMARNMYKKNIGSDVVFRRELRKYLTWRYTADKTYTPLPYSDSSGQIVQDGLFICGAKDRRLLPEKQEKLNGVLKEEWDRFLEEQRTGTVVTATPAQRTVGPPYKFIERRYQNGVIVVSEGTFNGKNLLNGSDCRQTSVDSERYPLLLVKGTFVNGICTNGSKSLFNPNGTIKQIQTGAFDKEHAFELDGPDCTMIFHNTNGKETSLQQGVFDKGKLKVGTIISFDENGVTRKIERGTFNKSGQLCGPNCELKMFGEDSRELASISGPFEDGNCTRMSF